MTAHPPTRRLVRGPPNRFAPRHPSLHWGGEALWGTLHDVRHEDQTAGMEATDLRFFQSDICTV